jgi:hypothetical protein
MRPGYPLHKPMRPRPPPPPSTPGCQCALLPPRDLPAALAGARKMSAFCRCRRCRMPGYFNQVTGRLVVRIGLSVHELIMARIKIAGNCALGRLPTKFFVEESKSDSESRPAPSTRRSAMSAKRRA